MFRLITCFLVSVFLTACGGGNDQSTDSKKNDSIPAELAALNDQIARDIDNASLYAQRAEYYFARQQVTASISDLNRAIKLDPQNADYYVRLSDFHFVRNETRLTRDLLQQAIKINPKNNDALLKLGELLYLVKSYDSAVFYINRSIAVQPDNAKAFFQKGMALKEVGDTLNAVKSFQSCIELDAKYFDAHLITANLFAAKNNSFAIEYYKNALNLQPNNIDVLYGLGLFFQNTKDLDKANDLYNQILKIDSSHVYSVYNKGYIELVERNKPKDAIVYFNKASQLDPQYSNAIYMRGLCYEKLGEKKLAATDYNATIVLDPSNQLAVEGLKRLSKK